MPLREVTVRRQADGFEAAWLEAERALSLAMPPVALELLRTDAGYSLVARLAGSEQGVRRIERELGWNKTPSVFWAELSESASRSWARLSVRPDALPKVLRSLPARSRWMAQPGVGVAYWFGLESADAVRSARAAAESEGGSVVLLAAPPELKREVGAWGRPPATIELMRRMRAAFDPGGTLSPGRYVV
jgi:FAD/FMN-containing dehydrogenase